jgi:hypothetical protein
MLSCVFLSYGLGILVGMMGLMAMKGAVRSVPLVGLIASPLLGEK